MALLKRIFLRSKSTSPSLTKPMISFQPLDSTVPQITPKSKHLASPETSLIRFFRRFLHRRASTQLPVFPEFFTFPTLRDKLDNVIVNRESVRFDGAGFPVSGDCVDEFSVKEVRKLLRLAHVEKVKMKLSEIPEDTISYDEFVKICVGSCGSEKHGVEFAKILDDAGSVIILGKIVFLRPHQVAKKMERMILETIVLPNDPRRKELEEMEQEKARIDSKAKAEVRSELCFGLGLMMVQSVGFMRLTFWELSWDVMEPICFFVTSIHFFMGYAFFLRTSKEPTFEGFFSRRFNTKQKRLMEKHNFDYRKYSVLRRACYPESYNEVKLPFQRID